MLCHAVLNAQIPLKCPGLQQRQKSLSDPVEGLHSGCPGHSPGFLPHASASGAPRSKSTKPKRVKLKQSKDNVSERVGRVIVDARPLGETTIKRNEARAADKEQQVRLVSEPKAGVGTDGGALLAAGPEAIVLQEPQQLHLEEVTTIPPTPEKHAPAHVPMEGGAAVAEQQPGSSEGWKEDPPSPVEGGAGVRVEVPAEKPPKEEKPKMSEEEAQELRREKLKELVQVHEFSGSRMFFYPEEVQAEEPVTIFFHRAQSALANRSTIVLMGGYNDWRWKNFKAELKPSTEIPGDWWSCTLVVPGEAYIMNFVFWDGENLYENNSNNDFFLSVNGGMDDDTFTSYFNELKFVEASEAARIKKFEEEKARREKIEAEQRARREAMQAQARTEADGRRGRASQTYGQAKTEVPGLWRTEPATLVAGKDAVLYYNRAHRPLGGSQKLFIHAGFNDWFNKVTFAKELEFDKAEDGDWWKAEFTVPEAAYMLNWVLADGPPGKAGVYDNNGNQDFHAVVEGGMEVQAFWDMAEERILARLEREQKEKDEAERKLAQRRAEVRQAMKQKTQELFLESQAHVIFTEPKEVRCGEEVTVFYNPTNTPLHGRQEVWMRGSFNRWTHRLGCWLPIKMTPAENGTHLQATVEVPTDAYVMDFVFSERGDTEGGIYDNRRGLDYHVPVTGGVVQQPPLSIVHIALEMAPIAKVGGLGDVVTSLSRAVQELGHKPEVIVPKYDVLKYNYIHNLEEKQPFQWGGTNIKTWFGYVEGIPTHFLEPENGMFWAGCIYGRKDDAARFGFFCSAALEFLQQTCRSPDIIHCHDWSSAPVAWLFQENYRHYGLANARLIFTIHNLEFGAAMIGRAMANSHMATTVSPTYAWEIGSHPAIRDHHGKFHGIRNGIDPDIWDPLGDPFLPMPYSSEDAVEGKAAARRELRNRLNLAHVDRPMVGIITRLTAQKGIHLIKHAIGRTLERGGQVVLLGSAPDSRIQGDFQNLANSLAQSHNNMARLWLSYDEPLSHLIYAGCDMILVPSMFEPCGLTQMVAMRYGAIPVVRKTGGLNDTVFDVDHDIDRARAQGLETNGFSFEGTDNAGLDYALNRAISAWYEAKGFWTVLTKRVMEQDWSWNRPALDYMELYYGARKLP